jgi:valyl-tRNA synthetase
VRDPYGQKMSKTKGNVEDPLQIIDEVGADALRFALLFGVSPGNDTRISRPKLEGARNFANKVWNATRFVVGARPESTDADEVLTLPERALLGPAESWILDRAARDIEAASRAMDEFRLGEALRIAYDGLWNAYADWYVEIAKVRLGDTSTSPAERDATWRVLAWTLDAYLRLLHPFMPFVTEEAWSHLPPLADDGPFLMVSAWPTPAVAGRAGDLADEGQARAVEQLIELVGAIRNVRHEAGIAPAQWLPATIAARDETLVETARALGPSIERLARLRPIEISSDAGEAHGTDGTLVALAGDARAVMRIETSLGAADRSRLERELDGARSALERAEQRLANPAFTERAPAEVVAGARTRADGLRQHVAALEERIR